MAQYKGAASEAGRAMQLMKKREKEREQLEQLKQKIAEVWNLYSTLLLLFIVDIENEPAARSAKPFSERLDVTDKSCRY